MVYIINKKNIICFLIVTSFFILSCSGQQKKEGSKKSDILKSSDGTESLIKEIRKEYIRINTDSSKYKVIEKDVNGESTEGGLLRKYFYNDTIQKAIAIFFGETGKSTLEYYFKIGKIIFIYEREDRYDMPIYDSKGKVKIIKENRYYFNGGRLIKWIGDEGKIKDVQYYSAKEAEIFNDLKEIQ